MAVCAQPYNCVADKLQAENGRLRAALRKIDERTNDPVARSIAGEALVIALEQGGLK